MTALGLGSYGLALLDPWHDVEVRFGWRLQENAWTGRYRILDDADAVRATGRLSACRRALSVVMPIPCQEVVLLVHGIGRTSLSMCRLRDGVRRAGGHAIALTYRSLDQGIDDHADTLNHIIDRMEGPVRISFACHSLGGLVVRAALARPSAWRDRIMIGRVVMIATPNRLSSLAQLVRDIPPYRVIAGTTGQELAAGSGWSAPPPPCRFGIIAGGTGRRSGFNPLFGEDNDGVVTVCETNLAGAADALRIRAFHSIIQNDPRVVDATVRFLRTGWFGGSPRRAAA